MLLVLVRFSAQQSLTPSEDVRTLRELPLERLLQVKNTLKTPYEKIFNDPKPEAMALQSKSSNNRGSTYGVHEDSGDSKKSGKKSVQSIFQLSVTTLAFLAFGGYLVCLIVQAIKGKQSYEMDAEEVVQYLINRPTRRRPVIRRTPPRRKRPLRRRTTKRPSRYRRPSRQKKPVRRQRREVWPDADPEKMYRALVSLSEAYTHYHTTDYKNYNYTVKHY